ncbi:MAG: Fe-S cluster assembly protein SufD [Flavobacteriales bacterium]|nr:Fe-S cluster assembly protein SufD [Flavobacteriales bacterium]
MSLKEKIISTYRSFEEAISSSSSINDIKDNAIKTFEEKGFPTLKDEDWKYTSLKSILKTDFCIVPSENKDIEIADIEKYFVDTDSFRAVVVDGYFSAELSTINTEKAIISSMKEAIEEKNELALKHISKIAPADNSMVALNTIGHADGIFISIPNNTILEKPIQLLHIATGISGETLVQTRNLIVVGKNCDAKIIERHQSLTENTILSNPVTEISVGENSYYYHYKIQNDVVSANLIDNTYVNQSRYSNAFVDTFSFGGNITRNNLSFFLNEENAVANLNGISLLNDSQHVDNFTFVDHRVANCDSHELYKGIYDESSKGVFTGKIFIHKDAQKTNGNQQNNNLILSENAQINTRPQLEIYADDVKANHGCTIGQLDKEALFFMRSRGIPKKEAKAMLMYAFASEALKNVKIEALTAQINKLIAAKLNVDIEFGE